MILEMEKYEKSRSPLIPRKSGTLSGLDGGKRLVMLGPCFKREGSYIARLAGQEIVQAFWK